MFSNPLVCQIELSPHFISNNSSFPLKALRQSSFKRSLLYKANLRNTKIKSITFLFSSCRLKKGKAHTTHYYCVNFRTSPCIPWLSS